MKAFGGLSPEDLIADVNRQVNSYVFNQLSETHTHATYTYIDGASNDLPSTLINYIMCVKPTMAPAGRLEALRGRVIPITTEM